MPIDVYVSFKDGRNALVAGVNTITLVDRIMNLGDISRDIFDVTGYLNAGAATGLLADADFPLAAADWTATTAGGTQHIPLSDDWAHTPPRPQTVVHSLVVFTLAANDPGSDPPVATTTAPIGLFFFSKLIVGLSTSAPSG